MKTRFWCWLFPIISVLLSSCSNGIYQDVKAHFYCVKGKYDRELQLYINGEFQTRIPFTEGQLNCENPQLADKTFTHIFKQGSYEVKVLTFSGELVSWGTFKFTNEEMELIGKAGAMDSRQNGDCLTIEIQ